jgi:hypothetical protein
MRSLRPFLTVGILASRVLAFVVYHKQLPAIRWYWLALF